jgi:hypothetical protein
MRAGLGFGPYPHNRVTQHLLEPRIVADGIEVVVRGNQADQAAAALGQGRADDPVQIPSEPGRFSYAINGASYRGAYATGGSMMYRLNTRAPMAVGFGFSRAGAKNSAVRFGIAGEF